jgi:Neuraminidase (sialidase)
MHGRENLPLGAGFGPALLLAALLASPGAAFSQVPQFGEPRLLVAAAADEAHSDDRPRVATDGKGTWVVVGEVTGGQSFGLGRDSDIVFSRSTDQGGTWSEPKPLTERFRTDRAEDREPALATDGKGTWIIVWTSSQDISGGSRGDRDIHYIVSTDNAATWTEARTVGSNADSDWGDDESPDIAVDGKGRWVTVWHSTDTLGNTVGGDRDILFAVSDDGGEIWSNPSVVDEAAKNDSLFDAFPRVATDAKGTWVVVWTSGGPNPDGSGYTRGVLAARSDDGGQRWARPVQLTKASGVEDRPDWGPQVIGDGRGNWVAAWASTDHLGDTIGYDRDILYSRSGDDGRTWSRRSPLNREAAEDSGDDGVPSLATDGLNWVAVWTSWEKRGGRSEGGIGADADIFVALSRDAGRSWTESYLLNSNAETDHGEDLDPSVATDGKGVWMAAWSTNDTFDGKVAFDRDIAVAVGQFGYEVAGPPAPSKNAD